MFTYSCYPMTIQIVKNLFFSLDQDLIKWIEMLLIEDVMIYSDLT
jgi:hypothetical protein